MRLFGATSLAVLRVRLHGLTGACLSHECRQTRPRGRKQQTAQSQERRSRPPKTNLRLLRRAALERQRLRAPLLRRLPHRLDPHVAAVLHGAVQDAAALYGKGQRRLTVWTGGRGARSSGGGGSGPEACAGRRRRVGRQTKAAFISLGNQLACSTTQSGRKKASQTRAARAAGSRPCSPCPLRTQPTWTYDWNTLAALRSKLTLSTLALSCGGAGVRVEWGCVGGFDGFVSRDGTGLGLGFAGARRGSRAASPARLWAAALHCPAGRPAGCRAGAAQRHITLARLDERSPPARAPAHLPLNAPLLCRNVVHRNVGPKLALIKQGLLNGRRDLRLFAGGKGCAWRDMARDWGWPALAVVWVRPGRRNDTASPAGTAACILRLVARTKHIHMNNAHSPPRAPPKSERKRPPRSANARARPLTCRS